MKFSLPISIYPIKAINKSKKAYKDYLLIKVTKSGTSVDLSISIIGEYQNEEKKEIIGSFFNYLLQSVAIDVLDLKAE